MNLISYLLFYFISIQIEIPSVIPLFSIYLIALANFKNIKFNSKSLADLSIVFILVAFFTSLVTALLKGNDIIYIFRYSGGLLLLPLYFSLKSYFVNYHKLYLKVILRVFLLISVFSVIYLLLSSFFGPFSNLTLFIRSFLGSGARSGYFDTRFYSLSTISATYPSGLLLMFNPKEYLKITFPKSIKINKKSNFTLVRIGGLIIFLTATLLSFSTSTLIITLIISLPFFYMIFKFFLRASSKVSKYYLNLTFLILFILVILIIIFMSFSKNLYFDNIQTLFNLQKQLIGLSGDPRIDQINYIFRDGNFTFFGRGLGSSFSGTELLRSADASYGIEVSYINILDKFGFFSILFLPYLLYLFRQYSYCFSNKEKDEIYIYRVSFLYSNTYLILALGNPIIFSLQLNFLSLIFLSLLSAKIEFEKNKQIKIPFKKDLSCI